MDNNPEMNQKEIARALGITQSRVSSLYREALEFFPYKSVEQHRELFLMENREAIDRTLEVLRGDHPYVSEGRIIHEVIGHDKNNRPIYGEPLQDVKPILQAAQTLTALHNRLMTNIGGDAPKRLETANLHVDASDLRVAPIIEQFRLSNASRQDQIARRVSSRREIASGPQHSAEAAVRRPVGADIRRRSPGSGKRAARPVVVKGWDPGSLLE
jgi:hypothetical protein